MMNQESVFPFDVESEVKRRYSAGANKVEFGLCCPTAYDARSLRILPDEIIEKDYGCGNPSLYAHAGDTVLDLGAGVGKICYILAQRVGKDGRVIGVDFNGDMLGIARKHMDTVAERLGYYNVQFVRGKIQDLALDLDAANRWLRDHPIRGIDDLAAFEAECARLRAQTPAIADTSVDLVVSNCVLNLVRAEDKSRVFSEIFRVLRPNGRAVISDIVCDEDPTDRIRNDAELWSGCIAGAVREDRFLEMFEEAGFYGIEILERRSPPWQTIDGIEFRSITVRAFKGKQGPCLERNQAVIYRGPWRSVTDDDGHTYYRGRRMATCDKTYRLMTDPKGPYGEDMLPVIPRHDVPLAAAQPFDCSRSGYRHPRETKGTDYNATVNGNGSCGPNCC